MASAPRWIVELRGHPFDFEDLPDLLVGSPLAVEKHGSGWILSPELFAGMTDANAVRELAETRTRLLDGLHRCTSHDAGPIAMGAVQSVDEKGTKTTHMFIQDTISVRAKARLSVIRNGVELPDDSVGRLRPLAQLALEDQTAAAILRFMSNRPVTWHDLYKVCEIVLSDAGGMRRVVERGWATRAEIEHFKETANHPGASGDAARHGVQKGGYTKTPMDVGTAAALVRRLASRWLDSCVEAKSTTGGSSGDDLTQ